jgi:L-iditol 2-dehydrogenase
VVNFFGGPPKGTVVGLDTNRLHYGDITLKATFHLTPATARTAFELIASGRFQSADFITRTASLNEVSAVFQRMMTRSADNVRDIKTAIFPNENEANGLRPSGKEPTGGGSRQ